MEDKMRWGSGADGLCPFVTIIITFKNFAAH